MQIFCTQEQQKQIHCCICATCKSALSKNKEEKRMGHKRIYNLDQANSGIQYENELRQHSIRARASERERDYCELI